MNPMRRWVPYLLLILAVIPPAGCESGPPGSTAGTSKPTWNVRFSPNGGCTQLVVDTLAQAKQTVFVQAYSFTSAPIAQALVDAGRRGVKVEAILDKSQRTEHYSEEEHNAENLLVLHDRELTASYQENWQRHRAHSAPYSR